MASVAVPVATPLSKRQRLELRVVSAAEPLTNLGLGLHVAAPDALLVTAADQGLLRQPPATAEPLDAMPPPVQLLPASMPPPASLSGCAAAQQPAGNGSPADAAKAGGKMDGAVDLNPQGDGDGAPPEGDDVVARHPAAVCDGRVPPGKVVKYGIVGTGMMGVEHIYNLANIPGVRIAAVADPHLPSRQAAVRAVAASSNEPVQVFASHRELLDSGVCDVVVVATPNMTHAGILLDVLAHEKPHHVLVEKPLCITVEDCQKVVALAEARKDLLVQVGLEYRYMAPIATLIRETRSGIIGKVRMVAIREHRYPFLVKVGNWNRFSSNTGGTLVEKCCHFFDLMSLIVGRRPLRVMASGGQDVNHLKEEYDGKVPDILDNAYVVVDYEGGARGLLDLCMFAEGSDNEQEISVVGDEGKIEAFVPEGTVRIGKRQEGRRGVKHIEVHDTRIKYEGLHHGSSYLEHLDFLAAVRSEGKRPPAVGLDEGLLSVAVGVAAHRSIDKGRPVFLHEVLKDAEELVGGRPE